jgi:hypothetical protein
MVSLRDLSALSASAVISLAGNSYFHALGCAEAHERLNGNRAGILKIKIWQAMGVALVAPAGFPARGRFGSQEPAAADDVCGTHADYGIARIDTDTDSDPDADKPRTTHHLTTSRSVKSHANPRRTFFSLDEGVVSVRSGRPDFTNSLAGCLKEKISRG